MRVRLVIMNSISSFSSSKIYLELFKKWKQVIAPNYLTVVAYDPCPKVKAIKFVVDRDGHCFT